jgi:outer membrane protein assembly factor BamB
MEDACEGKNVECPRSTLRDRLQEILSMLTRTRGLVPLLCLFAFGCSSSQNMGGGPYEEVDQPELYSDRVTALEAHMSQVALKRVWSGHYFKASTVEGALVDGADLFVWLFNGSTRHYEVHCVEAATGTLRWMVDVGETRLRYPPGADDRWVVCLLDDGRGMVVVKRSNGARQFNLRTSIQEEPTSPPASSDSTVYNNSLLDDRVHALNPDTGGTGWAYRTNGSVTSGPIMTPGLPRRLVIVGTDEGIVTALPPAAWNEVGPEEPSWERRMFGALTGQISLAERTVEDRLEVSVLAPCADHGLYCLDVATGEPRWVYRTASPFRGTPRTFNGRVFGRDTMRLHAIDLGTGDAAWQPSGAGEVPKDFESYDTALGADGTRVYLTRGQQYARANPRTGDLIKTARLTSFAHVLPAADANLIIGVTEDGHLVAFY